MTPAVPWQPHPGFDPNVLVEVNPDMLDPLAMPDLVDPMDVSIKTEVIDDEPVIHDHDIDNVGFGDTSDLHDENPVITDEPMDDAGDVSSLMISSVTFCYISSLLITFRLIAISKAPTINEKILRGR